MFESRILGYHGNVAGIPALPENKRKLRVNCFCSQEILNILGC